MQSIASIYSTIINAVQCQVIAVTIVEHPSSLLVPVNETAIFSCTAHVQCSSPPCHLRGQWIVDYNFISSSHNEFGNNELTLYLRIINSNSRNTSKVRCHFSDGSVSKDSNTAVLKWIDGELLY